MLNFIKNIYGKNKEVVNYLIFGVLTTIVNFVIYVILTKLIELNDVVSNAIAWFISVIFAYVTNKIYVFESNSKNLNLIIRELISFIGCRLLSGIFDIGMFWILVSIKFNDIIAKVLISILVVILNYIFSKLIIFKKNTDNSQRRERISNGENIFNCAML